MVEMCGQCKMPSLRKVTTPGRKAAFIQGRGHRTFRKTRVLGEKSGGRKESGMDVERDRHNVEGQKESAFTEGEGEGRNSPSAVFHCGKGFAILSCFNINSQAGPATR